MPESVVELNHISSGFPGRAVLSDLSLTVSKGELVMIEGATGVGKTTLIRLLLGAQPIQSGKGEVAGISLVGVDAQRLTELRRRVGVVFQAARVLPLESVLNNVSLPLAIAGRPRSECRAKGTRALMDVGLMNHSRQLPSGLSGGELARLQIARALINQPELLLADEPFAHLDSDSAADAESLIAAAHTRGMAIVITSHRPTSLSDRATHYRLEGGILT